MNSYHNQQKKPIYFYYLSFIITITVASIITIADLATKKIVFNYLINQNSGFDLKLLPFFSLVIVRNNGISFGMFNNINNASTIFTILQSTIAVLILIYASFNRYKIVAVALGLIVGGAFGNAIDRAINGAVADFLDFHWDVYHWPAFNLADSAICCGVLICLIHDLFCKKIVVKNS